MMYPDALELEGFGFAVGTPAAAPGQDWRLRVCLSCGALVHPAFCDDHRVRCPERALDADPVPPGVLASP